MSRLTFSIPGASGCVSSGGVSPKAVDGSSSQAISPPRGVTVRLSGPSSFSPDGDS